MGGLGGPAQGWAAGWGALCRTGKMGAQTCTMQRITVLPLLQSLLQSFVLSDQSVLPKKKISCCIDDLPLKWVAAVFACHNDDGMVI